MVKYSEKEIYKLENTTYIIYRITNMVNNKIYIGQTIKTFNKRYGGTKDQLGAERVLYFYEHGGVKNIHLLNSLGKYGTENFKVDILKEGLTREELNYWEELYIALFNSTDYRYGYNYKKGGNNHERVYDYMKIKEKFLSKLKDDKHIKFMDKMLTRLEEKQVNVKSIIDEIKNRRIIIIDERDESKCWVYKNVIEASKIHTGKMRPEVLFIMVKHNEKDEVFNCFGRKTGGGRQVYFQDTIDISDKYITNLCKRNKDTARLNYRRTKEERKRKND